MLVELPSIVSVWCNSTDVGSNPGCVIGVYNKKKKGIAELRVRFWDEKIATLVNFPLKNILIKYLLLPFTSFTEICIFKGKIRYFLG